MSLKARLRISIVSLVTLLVFAQCVVSLRITAEANFNDALDRAQAIASQVRHLVVQRVNEQAAAAAPPPATLEESKELWVRIVQQDPAFPSLLEKTMASSNAVVEIMICDGTGRILASSSPSQHRITYLSLPDFSEWRQRPLWDRLIEVLSQSKDYAIVVPLGVPQLRTPILTIRVVVSSVLLRNAILPQVRSLFAVSLLSMLASMILAALFSNILLRSLERLSRRIELIATGQFQDSDQPPRESKEIAAVQSKLNLLSEQYRGAREDVVQLRGNIERMLERLEEAVLIFEPDQRLLRASRSAQNLLGLNEQELAERTLREFFPGSTPVGALIQSALERRQPVHDALVLLHRAEGAPTRLLVNVELLESYHDPARAGILVTLRDAETRRQIRSQLDVSTRLAAISRLTGGVAHEIKNPLNAIALHLEILKAKLEKDGIGGAELEVIGNEIARLDRVVKTFLDFTRPVELAMRAVDLVPLLEQLAALVRPEAERSRVQVHLNLSVGRAVVRGDADLLKQAILNVVANGVDAMPEGGRLRIGLNREGADFVVTVADEGTGIPEEVRDKIFNLYFSTKEKGSGIGLAMTFRVIQLHNAAIDFSSCPGRGTEFYLRFPAADEEEDDGSGAQDTPSATHRMGSRASAAVLPESNS